MMAISATSATINPMICGSMADQRLLWPFPFFAAALTGFNFMDSWLMASTFI
jgi:hypothetical protein